jgi:hypothetical protein
VHTWFDGKKYAGGEPLSNLGIDRIILKWIFRK